MSVQIFQKYQSNIRIQPKFTLKDKRAEAMVMNQAKKVDNLFFMLSLTTHKCFHQGSKFRRDFVNVFYKAFFFHLDCQ